MRNVRTFIQHGTDLPVAIDMERIEAVMARAQGGVVIITPSDTYHVDKKFGEVMSSWHDATKPESKKRKEPKYAKPV